MPIGPPFRTDVQYHHRKRIDHTLTGSYFFRPEKFSYLACDLARDCLKKLKKFSVKLAFIAESLAAFAAGRTQTLFRRRLPAADTADTDTQIVDIPIPVSTQ